MREAAGWENKLYDRLSDVLDGFKEVRLNRARSDALYRAPRRRLANRRQHQDPHPERNLRRWCSCRPRCTSCSARSLSSCRCSAAAPRLHHQGHDGAGVHRRRVLGLVQSIPIIAAANAAADRIERLEVKLRAIASLSDEIPGAPAKRFAKIEMRDVVFHYPGKPSDAPFRVGPFNFTLHSGDLVFLTGGNGSGKSTFMKILAGFYTPEAGRSRSTASPFDRTRDDYRAPDHGDFPRLPSVPAALWDRRSGPAEVDRLLTEFKLQDKTRLVHGEFSTLDLSSGQRRRLALIVAQLEKRPLLMLDEWAADQDPEFRRKFYFRVAAGAAPRRHHRSWPSRTTTAISTKWRCRPAGCAWTKGVSRAAIRWRLADETVSDTWMEHRPAARKRNRWWRFIERQLPIIVIYLMVATLVGFVIAPNVIVTVPTGHVGILWKRFRGGTQLDRAAVEGRGPARPAAVGQAVPVRPAAADPRPTPTTPSPRTA